ncbi:hypothetical protein F511_33891 [Dorcoceras hygrometricum]|uniref:Uncharacterized protein n=1 Tax=Dorcoceras hygrometricum TaxID=472368 RepID=A0A2Z7BMQ4_9LAMI|nr:hypothetical protein F511_33891 [Dorcoceras hygrometricum]
MRLTYYPTAIVGALRAKRVLRRWSRRYNEEVSTPASAAAKEEDILRSIQTVEAARKQLQRSATPRKMIGSYAQSVTVGIMGTAWKRRTCISSTRILDIYPQLAHS